MIDQFIDQRAFQDIQQPPRLLSAEQVEAFNRDGCVVLRGVLDPQALRTLKLAADRLFAATDSEWVGGPELKDGQLRDYVNSPLVQGVVNDLNGGPSAVLLGFLYRKRRISPVPKEWHQDAVYWDMSDARVMALFTPLTPIHAANGPINFIPGSHRLGRLFHRAAPNYNLVCDISAFREQRSVELAPGDLMALHTLTLHQSPENPSEEERINFGVHFHNLGTRVVPDESTAALYGRS